MNRTPNGLRRAALGSIRCLVAPGLALVLGSTVLVGCSSSPGSGGVGPVSASPAGGRATSSGAPAPAHRVSGSLAAPAPASVVPPTAQDGLPPVVHRIATQDKVVFLSIDDGWTKDPALPGLLRQWGVPVTVFATNDAIKDDLGYLRELRSAGATVQNHTLTHPDLRRSSQATATKEICGASDHYARDFGERPWLFRPPYGSYDAATQRAAKACGIDFLVLWDVSQPGRWLRFADGSALRSGDIVLLHFVPHLSEYLAHTLRVIKASGFTVGRLEDYLPRTTA